DLRERLSQVFLNVVGERLQGRDVHHLRFVAQRPLEPLAQQGVDRRQEGGERLPGARGRGDQRVAARLNDGPGAPLRLGGLRKPVAKPALDRGVEASQWHDSNMARLTPGRRPGVTNTCILLRECRGTAPRSPTPESLSGTPGA